MGNQIVWINTTNYTVSEQVVFGLGCVFWAIAYIGIVNGIVKKKFVEMPALAAMANIAWEFNWGWVYKIDMGQLFVIGYQIWFFLDVFINYGLYRYGHKQIKNPILRRYFHTLYIVGLAAWIVTLFFFIGDGYDTPTGATSAFILTIIIAVGYIALLAEQDVSNFSFTVAWTSFIGNALFGAFVFMALDNTYFLYTLVVVTMIFNAAYLGLFHYKAAQASRARQNQEELLLLSGQALPDLP